MKLYDVPRNTHVRIVDSDVCIPVSSLPTTVGETLLFHRIDGMYSLCHTMQGSVVHLAAWTEVEIVPTSTFNGA